MRSCARAGARMVSACTNPILSSALCSLVGLKKFRATVKRRRSSSVIASVTDQLSGKTLNATKRHKRHKDLRAALCFLCLFVALTGLLKRGFTDQLRDVCDLPPMYLSNHSRFAFIAANCIFGSFGPCGCRGSTIIRVGTPCTFSAL